MDTSGLEIFIKAFAIIISLIIAEMIRGYCAYLLGDKHGYTEGRFANNPLETIDFFSTIVIPIMAAMFVDGFILGACVPTIINYHKIKWKKFGAALVILTKPLAHFGLSLLSAYALKISISGSLAYDILIVSIQLNAFLMVWFLLPILPFATGQIIELFLPYKYKIIYRRHEKYVFPVLMVILILSYSPIFAPYIRVLFEPIFFMVQKVIIFIVYLSGLHFS